jgi:hypothetical protein
MPRPIPRREIREDIPFKILDTTIKENSRKDATNKILDQQTVPITHHYNECDYIISAW